MDNRKRKDDAEKASIKKALEKYNELQGCREQCTTADL